MPALCEPESLHKETIHAERIQDGHDPANASRSFSKYTSAYGAQE
jgi:hypothetical protein